MSRLVMRRLSVFIGLVGIAVLIIAGYFYFLRQRLSAPCEGTAGFTDGHVYLVDSSASARAWLDTNSDGYRDPSESSLENVCMWASTELERFDEESRLLLCADPDLRERLITDTEGEWGGPFFAGACCNDVYIFAIPPEGYQATTALVVNDCFAEFGFVLAKSPSETEQLSPMDYVLQLQRQQRRAQAFDVIKTSAIVIGVLFAALIGSFVIVRPQAA